VDISFQTSKLQKVCNSGKNIDREFGAECGKKLRQRLAELAAASCLADMLKLPQARCHELKGDPFGAVRG
jgi:plasmid maintenance system killer protein